jgi:hypothetical protein
MLLKDRVEPVENLFVTVLQQANEIVADETRQTRRTPITAILKLPTDRQIVATMTEMTGGNGIQGLLEATARSPSANPP